MRNYGAFTLNSLRTCCTNYYLHLLLPLSGGPFVRIVAKTKAVCKTLKASVQSMSAAGTFVACFVLEYMLTPKSPVQNKLPSLPFDSFLSVCPGVCP
jgi:hypothetical protein